MAVFKGNTSWYSSLFPKTVIGEVVSCYFKKKEAKMERNGHHDILSWRYPAFNEMCINLNLIISTVTKTLPNLNFFFFL